MDSFSRVSLLIGEDNLEILKNKTVLVIGVGGVGSSVVSSLVRSGVGGIILADSDNVDITNINRQVMASINTVGWRKVDAMEQYIKNINPKCSVTKIYEFIDRNNISLLKNYKFDYLVDACDSLDTKFSIIDFCLLNNIKFISSMGTANRFDPTLLEIIDIRKTQNDPLAKRVRKYVKDKKYKDKIMVLCSRELPMKLENGKLGSIMPVPSAAGLIISSFILRQFINK